ncbi:MAG: prolyl oligopeptidase family serine peptidase [Bacteroidetes bacterium]|nr:prolyl oligopeptidase family serine peptidase [Bacteroidota bacterium]
MTKRTIVLFTGLFILLPGLLQAQQRAMTTDDILNMTNLGSAIISPDGESVIFGKSELDWKENKRKTTYYYIPADSGNAYQYIGEEGGSDLNYSPDGEYLALKRTKDEKAQIFLMPTSGGEAVQLTEHETAVDSYTWGADSKTIYFKADQPKPDEKKKEYEAGYDHFMVDQPPHGQREGSWHELWKIDIDSKETQKLIHEEVRIGDFTVSPDQSKIVYTGRFENRRNQQYMSEIFLLTIGDSTARQLTDNDVPEGSLNWMPDNQHIVYSASSDEEWELRQSKLWLMDTADASYEMMAGAFDGNIGNYEISGDGDTLFFTGSVRTVSNLFSLDVESGNITQHTDFDGLLRVVDYSKDQSRLLIRKENTTTPPDLYTAFTNQPDDMTRLTDLNPIVRDSLELADFEIVTWNSTDGLEIEGIYYKPQDHQYDGSAPFLLHIHGGPAGVFSNRFSPQIHVWAGLGYVQLAPNVRGSTAYGDELLRGNMNDIGDGDYEDLMSGVDMLIEQKSINSDKMAVRGWSYGGILGGTTITKTDRFKAASLGAGVYDWTSEYAMGFNHDVRLWYIGGEPWTNPEGYRSRSAAMNAEHVTTPILFIHGERDRVDTPQQSLIFFTYLKDIGKVDTRYLFLKREGHGIREPRNQRTRDIEEIKWIQKYTLGEEWEPWERKSDEKEEGDSSDEGE